jgi:hypothetical protein
MPTSAQLRLVHIAAKKVGLNDAQYRTLLANAAGVASSKDLDQAGFEDVMAVLEDMLEDKVTRGQGDKVTKGDPFTPSPPHPVTLSSSSPTYWRDKVAARSLNGNARMVHKIRELAQRSIYPLDRLVWRQSGGRTSDVEQLLPREAWKLIEMLKGSNQRTEAKHAQERQRQASLF